MKTNKTTGQKFCETRRELAEKYFGTYSHTPFEENLITQQYAKGNMGLVSLLSDTQEIVARGSGDAEELEHYRQILNDIKCVLIADTRKAEDEEDKG